MKKVGREEKGGKKDKTDTDFLARIIKEGFEEVHTRLNGIDGRLNGIDGRFNEVDGRLVSLEKGQAETHRRLDSIEKKQVGMLASLDEAVHQSEFKRLVRRVQVLESR